MKRALDLTQTEFESSCYKTPEYLAWHRLFKREFSTFLTLRGCYEVDCGRPNHFDMSGFFTAPGGKIWYFSISDLRGSKDSMLVRTAQSYKDYTGGHNRWLPLNQGLEMFDRDFERVVLNAFH